MWPTGHGQIFFGTINRPLACRFELGRSTSPPLDCQGFKAPLSPRRGFTFWSQPRGRLAEPNVLKSDFDTLVGLEARAVSEIETEAERLRAHARRALELAGAINDPEAALRLKTLAADLLERAAAIELDGRAEFV